MAATIYRLADGTRVPGVTTVIKNLGGNNEGLLRWAYKVGLSGQDFDEARQKACNIGTVTHSLIEAHSKNMVEPDLSRIDPAIVAGAMRAYEMFREWRDENDYAVVGSEVSIVSESLRCGGTMDLVSVKKKRLLTDWKTSKDIYPEHYIQVAAYGELWNELHPDEPIEGYVLLRLGKDAPAFDHYYRPADHPAIATGLRIFRRLRELHDDVAEMKRVS